MKKKLHFLLLLLLLISCSNDQPQTVFKLEDKYYNEYSSKLIDDPDFSLTLTSLRNNDSFGVFLYLNGCSACAQFKPHVINVISELKIGLLNAPLSEIKLYAGLPINKIKYAPSIALIKEGSLVSFLDASADEDIKYYREEKELKGWFTSFIDI